MNRLNFRDKRAVREYERKLRRATPATVEWVHYISFAKLTESQRDLMFDQFLLDPSNGLRPKSRRSVFGLVSSALATRDRPAHISSRSFLGTDPAGWYFLYWRP